MRFTEESVKNSVNTTTYNLLEINSENFEIYLRILRILDLFENVWNCENFQNKVLGYI